MKNALRLHKLAACLGVVAVLAGCASIEGKGGDTAMGSGIGAAIGAGLGVLIGDSTEGALIGAGIGAVAGGIVGYNWSAIKNDVEKSGASDLGVAVTEMPDGTLRVHIPSNVSFDSGQYQLKPALLPVLDSVARALIQHPELRAKAIGYTDNTGSLQLNQTLSLERAQAVTGYMANQGVPPSHMTDEGRGPSNPIASNDTQEGRSLNRRVELFLYAVQQP